MTRRPVPDNSKLDLLKVIELHENAHGEARWMLAHEINTRLNAILNLASELEDVERVAIVSRKDCAQTLRDLVSGEPS